MTLAILVVAFGSLVAAGIPLLLGLSCVFIALGIIAPLSQIWPVEESISSVILLIGLAVGVDYSMFYLRRRMEERDAGRPPAEALAVAAATSGRAVLVSGLTVMIAMAGMLLAGNAVFTSFGIGTMIVVAVAVLGSMTVLPATLSKLGDRVEKGRVPVIAAHRHRSHENRAWSFVLDHTLRRPVLSLALGAGLLLLLASPALHLQTVNTGVQGLPRNLPIMKTYDRIQAAFPGGPLPAFVTVQARDVTSGSVDGAIERLRIDAVDTGLMSDPTQVTVNPRRDLAIVSIPLKGTGTDTTSNRALTVLRDQIIPDTLGAIPGVRAHTTGLTAGSRDFNDTMKAHLPLVFGFVLSLAFLLLLVTFRSIVVPIKAIVLNLLSVAAAYGVLTWVFQEGHLQGLLGFTAIGGITAWLPLFLFVILFGLSMDYHVFILSRIREAVDRGERTEQAVLHGIKSTAGIVTSAAARDDRRVLHLRDPRRPGLQDDGRRAGRRRAGRRDGRARRAAAVRDEAPRRVELVPAAVAAMAARGPARGTAAGADRGGRRLRRAPHQRHRPRASRRLSRVGRWRPRRSRARRGRGGWSGSCRRSARCTGTAGATSAGTQAPAWRCGRQRCPAVSRMPAWRGCRRSSASTRRRSPGSPTGWRARSAKPRWDRRRRARSSQRPRSRRWRTGTSPARRGSQPCSRSRSRRSCCSRGLFHLGFLADLLSRPVLVGFTAAMSLVIIAAQLPNLLGVSGVSTRTFQTTLGGLGERRTGSTPTSWRSASVRSSRCSSYAGGARAGRGSCSWSPRRRCWSPLLGLEDVGARRRRCAERTAGTGASVDRL